MPLPRVAGIFFAVMMLLGADMVSGQNYPSKPVRILTAEAGGSADLIARMIAQGISGPLGQQVVVDNRVAMIAIETAARVAPDGYTLLEVSNILWALPLMQHMSFDPVKDFSPISLAVTSPNLLVVHPSLRIKSVKELLALAKARPGEINYGTSGAGSSNYFAAELFRAMGGINIVRINYKGGGSLLNSLLGGEVQLMFGSSGSVTPHVKSGRLRALAVTGAQPSALLPELPTVASAVPGYEAVAVYGLLAPAGTPTAVIGRLNRELVQMLNTAEAKKKFLDVGLEVVASSPEQFAAAIKSDMARISKVINDAGMRTD